MKKIFIIVSFLMVINSSCQTTEPNNEIEFEVVVENLVSNYSFPIDGYYYEYQFENYKDNINNVEEVLRRYILSGVSLQDAWYKSGSSNCHPPNSKYVMHVIVEPNFVIRTKFKNNFLLNNNFLQIDEPPHFNCGYRVRHFIPKNNYY
jgi:hypothetical protein